MSNTCANCEHCKRRFPDGWMCIMTKLEIVLAQAACFFFKLKGKK